MEEAKKMFEVGFKFVLNWHEKVKCKVVKISKDRKKITFINYWNNEKHETRLKTLCTGSHDEYFETGNDLITTKGNFDDNHGFRNKD